MATLTSKLILELVDRATGPARAVSAAISRLTAAQTRNAAALAAAQTQMIGAVGAAYALGRALAAPIGAATRFETSLEDIGQKIDIPVEGLPQLGAELRAVARQTTQTAAEMAKGMDVLAGMGASRADALGLLQPIGRAATAYRAEVADLAKAGFAALDNLKVPANQFGRALDSMAQAGKAGAFELRDMAQYFPALGAAYQGLKQTGVPAVADLAAALQITRKGAGDSAEAATNLANILQKINAPDTRKNFKKMGVDLEKEMKKRAKAGMTPIEAIADLVNTTLKGNLDRLGDLFGDAQVQKGLRPLIQNIEEYRRIRREALAAHGVVEADYERRLKTGAMASQRFRIALENINLAVGAALLPGLTALADVIGPIANRMAAFAEANPELTRAVVATTTALIGLRIAGIAAKWGLLWMWGGALATAAAGMRGLAAAIWVAQAAMLPFGAALRAVRTAMVGFAAVTAILGAGGALKMLGGVLLRLLGPVGAIAGAVLLLYQNWTWVNDKIKEFTGIDLSAAGSAIFESLWSGMKAVWDRLSGWLSGVAARIKGFVGLGGGASAPASESAAPAVEGARAAGGPVHRGMTYLVGEEGPELWQAPASGYVFNARDTLRAGAAAAQASSGSVRHPGGGGAVHAPISITINAAPGQSPEAIAAAVERKLSEKFAALSRAAYSDGVYA